MRFALIDEKRAEAKPGLIGVCPGCDQPVIAKCGTRRIRHWAHRSDKKCDNWWEPETDWLRSWKSNFPDEWQERILPDVQTGEKHIADICTDYGWVIEFQHSHIHPQERASRENFYKNMVWVVDSTRLKNDYKRFLNVNNHSQLVQQGMFLVGFPDECFPAAWLNSSFPVIFDFQGTGDIAQPLYCLFPNRIGERAVLTRLSRHDLINAVLSGNLLVWADGLMTDILQVSKEKEDQIARQKQIQANVNFERFSRAMRYRNRRRF